MRIIYRANNIVEAHIVAGMLEATGIRAFVGGHYLQGGVGELAPQGFANVFVEDEDVEAALKRVQEYEGNGVQDTGTTSFPFDPEPV